MSTTQKDVLDNEISSQEQAALEQELVEVAPTDHEPAIMEGESEEPAEAKTKLEIDLNALWVVRRLRAKGYEAYLTGGCVRDLLLEKTPKDFDVATSARPEEVKQVFRNCRLIGRRFLLAHIFFPGGKIIETATFRSNPTDVQEDLPEDLLVKQDNVYGTVEEDAKRRDLTINGLFYDPIGGEVLDFVGGREDLDKKIIRTIGDPDIRFQEDPVRIIRAIKFATRLGFHVEEATWAAMKRHAGLVIRCAPARVQEEIVRLLTSQHALESIKMCREVGLLDVLMPELTSILNGQYVAVPFAKTQHRHEEPEEEQADEESQTADLDKEEVIQAVEGGEGEDLGLEQEPNMLAPINESTLNIQEPSTPVDLNIDIKPAWEGILRAMDEVSQRHAHLSPAVAFAALLLPAYRALESSTHNERNWIDRLCVNWAERIRLIRRDQDRIRLLLSTIAIFESGKLQSQAAHYLVRKQHFKEAMLLYILYLLSEGRSLEQVGQWKALAKMAGRSYKQDHHHPHMRMQQPNFRRRRSFGRSRSRRRAG